MEKSSTLRRRLFSVKSLMKESLKQKNLKIFWISWLTLKATYRLDLCLCPPLPSWQAKVLSWKKSSFFAREESQPEEAVFPIWFVLPFKILKICFCRGRQRSATELTESFFTGFYWRLRLVNTRSSLEEVFFQIWNICQSLKKFFGETPILDWPPGTFLSTIHGIAQLRPIGSWINLMETFSFFKTIGAILVWYLFHRNLQISGGKLHISTTWRK